MKKKTWVKRWAVDKSENSGLVDLYHAKAARAVDGVAQMQYSVFLSMFGIPLEPERVYSLRINATARPRVS